jgi:hypothetical protein
MKHTLANRKPILWTAARAWWSDAAAQDCAAFHWLFIFLLFLASSIAISLPFGANRWREAAASSQATQYPGLGYAFETLASAPLSFTVKDGVLQLDPAGPQTLTTKDWIIELGTDKNHAGDTQKVLQFSPTALIIRNGLTGTQVSSSLKPFEGFSSNTIKKAAENRRTLSDLIEGVLYTAAFSSIPSILLTLGLLMLVQNLAFVVILGIMLSFAVYGKAPGTLKAQEQLKPLQGIKMAAAIMAGPAFLIGLVGLFIPAFKAPFLWLAYSLLAGIRVIILYTSRYRSARTK